MKLARDGWLAIGLFVVLAAITIFAAVRDVQAPSLPRLASESNAPEGARALWLWLEQLGYQVTRESPASFRVADEADLLLVLEPTFPFASGDWREIDDWVADGGTAVFAGQWLSLSSVAGHYDFFLGPASDSDAVGLQVPLFNSPPFRPSAPLRAALSFNASGREDFVTLLAGPDGPVVLAFEQGKGRVILSAVSEPFTNEGLKQADNASVVLNVVSAARRRGVVMFDEWHHGLRSAEAELAGPGDWLFATPAGRAMLFVAGVVFLALVFRGQRFGRPVPLSKEMLRRAPLEHITAIANLSRRAGHRAAVVRQYHQHLKRALGQRYRLSPDLPDAPYAAQLAAYNPAVDEKRLLDLLARLSRRAVSEAELLQMAGEVVDWTKDQ